MSKWIDLSHTITDGLETYKGLPAISICDYWTREESASKYEGNESFQIAEIKMVANTGTYIDFPFHRYADGDDAAAVPIAKLAGIEGIKVNCTLEAGRAIGLKQVTGLDVSGKAVLFQTNWDRHWNTETYHQNGPYLSEEAAQYLAHKRVKMVGIDAHNIDDVSKARRPVHSILLAKGIYIIEHMTNLCALEDHAFLFYAVPPKIKGLGSFPVRAMACLK